MRFVGSMPSLSRESFPFKKCERNPFQICAHPMDPWSAFRFLVVAAFLKTVSGPLFKKKWREKSARITGSLLQRDATSMGERAKEGVEHGVEMRREVFAEEPQDVKSVFLQQGIFAAVASVGDGIA